MLGARSLAFLSYSAVAFYPLFSEQVVTNFGQFGGTLLIYTTASVLLSAWLVSDRTLWRETKALCQTLISEAWPHRVKLVLLLNAVGAISFYAGLSRSTAPAEYGIFARLEPVLLILGGWAVLGERIGRLNLIGIVIAFAASAAMMSTWTASWTATFFGSCYVLAMALGGILVKDILNREQGSWSALLVLRTYSVGLACLCVLPFSGDMPSLLAAPSQPVSLLFGAITGIVMLVIIGFRYKSQTKLSLWECSAMAPFSAVMGTLVFWVTDVTFGVIPAVALLCICFGELLAHADRRMKKRLAEQLEVFEDTQV